MEKLHPFVKHIDSISEDIRAEVIVSDLLSGKIRPEDLIIRFNGQQKRAKSSDIASVDIVDKKHSQNQLQVTLNRDSIYDTLPEGIFHQPSEDIQTESITNMVDEYRRQQKEEEDARQFFSPFENELFFQKTLIESDEYKQLFQIQQSRLNGVVLQELDIDPELPQHFTAKLVRMISYSSKIAGDIKQTKEIFTLLLKNKVTLYKDRFLSTCKSSYTSYLGQATLGANTVAGNQVIPDHMCTKLIVGPISKEELLLYKDGWKKNALQTIINFFIPVEWEVTTEFDICREETEHFVLNNEKSDARLGYTTTLQEA